MFLLFVLYFCQRTSFGRSKTLSVSFNCLATADVDGDGDGDVVLAAPGQRFQVTLTYLCLSPSLSSSSLLFAIYNSRIETETDNFKHIMLVW